MSYGAKVDAALGVIAAVGRELDEDIRKHEARLVELRRERARLADRVVVLGTAPDLGYRTSTAEA